MRKAYTDAFVLHNPLVKGRKAVSDLGNMEREELLRSWGKCLRFQPLWRIRNYFGEKVALYFSWLGTYIYMSIFMSL